MRFYSTVLPGPLRVPPYKPPNVKYSISKHNNLELELLLFITAFSIFQSRDFF